MRDFNDQIDIMNKGHSSRPRLLHSNPIHSIMEDVFFEPVIPILSEEE